MPPLFQIILAQNNNLMFAFHEKANICRMNEPQNDMDLNAFLLVDTFKRIAIKCELTPKVLFRLNLLARFR